MKLHDEELHNLCYVPDIRITKLRRMRCSGHRVYGEGDTNSLVRKPESKRPPGRLKCGWEGILKWILNRVGGCGLDSSGSGEGAVMDCCLQGSEPLGLLNGMQFFD
jgi:hypothetical protein